MRREVPIGYPVPPGAWQSEPDDERPAAAAYWLIGAVVVAVAGVVLGLLLAFGGGPAVGPADPSTVSVTPDPPRDGPSTR